MTQLALKLSLGENETIMSFVSRLAAKNGPSFVQDFCLDLGLKWQKLIFGDIDEIRRLSSFIGITRENLMQRSLSQIDRRSCELNGQLLMTTSFPRREQKLCPLCVSADEQVGGEFGVFGRREWLLATFRVCPTHNCRLVALPPASFPLHPADFFRRYESCRKLIFPNQSNPQFVVSTGWEAYLLGRLSGKITHDWIDRFDLDAAMRIVQSFGIIFAYGTTAREADLNHEELSKACELGFEAISGSQAKVDQAFIHIQNRSDSSNPGFYTDFGMFARFCTRVSCDNRYQALIDVVTKFAFDNYPMAKGEWLYGRKCPSRVWHNCSSAANEYGFSPPRMTAIVDALKIGERKAGNSRIIRTRDTEEIFRDISRCIPRIKCIHKLGTYSNSFEQIVNQGFLKPKYDLPQVAPLFDPDDIENLLSDIRSRCNVVGKPSGRTLTIAEACNGAKCHVYELLTKILSGELVGTIWLDSEIGLRNLRFDLENIRDAFETEPTSELTRPELRSMLCVNASTISLLIRTQQLKSQVIRHHRNRRPMHVVKRSEVRRFLSKYVSLGELAKKEGIQANWVAARLAKEDIHPIKLPPNISKLYLRNLIEGQ